MFTDNYTRKAIVKRIIDGDTLDAATQDYVDALIKIVNAYGVAREKQEHDIHILNQIREEAFEMLKLPDIY